MLRGMKLALFVPLAYILDSEGFLLVGPYLVLFLILSGLTRSRSPRAVVAPRLSDLFEPVVNPIPGLALA